MCAFIPQGERSPRGLSGPRGEEGCWGARGRKVSVTLTCGILSLSLFYPLSLRKILILQHSCDVFTLSHREGFLEVEVEPEKRNPM